MGRLMLSAIPTITFQCVTIISHYPHGRHWLQYQLKLNQLSENATS